VNVKLANYEVSLESSNTKTKNHFCPIGQKKKTESKGSEYEKETVVNRKGWQSVSIGGAEMAAGSKSPNFHVGAGQRIRDFVVRGGGVKKGTARRN